MSGRYWLTLLFGFAASCGLHAQSAQLKARLDSAAILIGDPNAITVFVPADRNGPFRVDWSPLDTIEGLVVTGEETMSTKDGLLASRLPFSVFDSAGILFPPLAVYFTSETLYTNDLALLVDFPPADTARNDYRPLRIEARRISDYLPWIIAIGLGLVCTAVLVYFLYFAKREPAAVRLSPKPVVPPHLTALRELEQLKAQDGLDDKAYYTALDTILRTYLEKRFGVPALERTTGEVIELIQASYTGESTRLASLLDEVVMVKFAKAALPPERRSDAIERVAAFVRETVPPPTVPTAEQQSDG